MSLSIRYLLARPDGTFEHMSLALMNRLSHEAGSVFLPEFAGTRLRYVEAIVDTTESDAPEIARLLYSSFAVNAAGYIDSASTLRTLRAKLDAAFAWPEEPRSEGNVIFAEDTFTLAAAAWRPSREVEGRIYAILLKEERVKRFNPIRRIVPVKRAPPIG